MTSIVLQLRHDCAPHTIRTVSIAFAIALNLAALLMALRPLDPRPMSQPVLQPDRLHAFVLQQPVLVPPPALPVLRPMRHVLRTPPVTPIARPAQTVVPQAVPTASTDSPPQVVTTVSADTTAGSTDATLAYETATPPTYPIQALRDGSEGTVWLRVLVDENGRPVQVLIERSSGSRALDEAARQHVLAAWSFHPARENGRTVRAWARLPVKFSLAYH